MEYFSYITDMFWEIDNWEATDPHLKALKEMPFQRSFPFIPDLNTTTAFYVIRGPRQVGKTSWLKAILSDHISKGAESFFMSCEGIDDHRELRELLYSLRKKHTILLDEVNYVSGWDRAVKQAIDAGETRFLVVTGSHAYDLIRGSDRMPGRFGAGGETTLLPMNFDEFRQARSQAGWSSGSISEEIEAYFRIGGFPSALAEARDSKQIPKNTCQMLWRWLSGDVVRLGRNEEFLVELLIQLVKTLQSPVSFQTLAKKTSIASHTTVQEYITLLESLFALRTLRFIDPDTGAFRSRKNRKFYFTDPLIIQMIIEQTGITSPTNLTQQIAENIAHEELARRYKRFGYYSTSKGEIDFMSPQQWGLEVKWSETASDLSKLYLSTTLPWKKVWTKGNYLREYPK